MSKYQEKCKWLLDCIEKTWKKRLTLHEESLEIEDHQQFGVKLKIYTIGPPVCPDLARTLRRMWRDGLLRRSTFGNHDAVYNCQKTWGVAYYLPEKNLGVTWKEYHRRPLRFKRKRQR